MPNATTLRLLPAVGLLAILTACGAADDETSTNESAGSDGGSENTMTSQAEPTVEIVDTGFGQDGEYAQGIAIVTTESEAALGEFVTVSANFLDADGAIVATEEQVESFSWIGQELVLPVWLDLSSTPKTKVASIDASASISEHGTSQEERPALPTLEATEINEEYGQHKAAFAFTNDGEEDLEDLRVGVACYGPDGEIIGGGSAYPGLVTAGKTVRLDIDVKVGAAPETCKAYPNYGI